MAGGLIFGALGVLFAPQISKALSGENGEGGIKLPRFDFFDDAPPAEGAGDTEATRANLQERISQLNNALDDVSTQLKMDKAIALKNETAAAEAA